MINIKRLLIIFTIISGLFSQQITAQSINQVDDKGRRTGVWKKLYEDGKIRYTGTFQDGKEVGVFKFYERRSDYPTIIKEYTAKSDSAMVKFFSTKGTLKSSGMMLGKNRVGKWDYFFSNGKIFSEEFYKDGKLHGILKNYYPNGKVTEETYYINGLKEGASKTYAEDGVLIEEVYYVNGKLNGPAIYYDLKGNIKEKGEYKDGARFGKWDFYMDGELSERKKEKLSLDRQ